MGKGKTVSLTMLAICITIMLSANSIPVLAQGFRADVYCDLSLSSFGVIMDPSGRVVGWRGN
jgi:hypothetical protein